MKPGDHVCVVEKDDSSYEGILMPSSDSDAVILKLSSGYNMGFSRKSLQSITLLKKGIVKEKKVHAVPVFKKEKTIAILHTGGTLASKVDYQTGAVSPRFDAAELLQMFPELQELANIRSRSIGTMFSEDMRFFHYNLIAKEIVKEIKEGVDGVIVTHGTDTLAMSSCALSFILENLSIPVLFVGAQRSSDRPSSDASFNLLCAARFIVSGSYHGVAVCMHANSSDAFCSILPACKTRKMHTSRRDAFISVNEDIIAKVSKDHVELFVSSSSSNAKKLQLRLFDEKLKIGILKAHPHMYAFEVKNYFKFDGVVLEGFGLAGHFPINVIDAKTKEHALIFHELKKLAKKIPVAAASQCIFGRINMHVYSTGRSLEEIGVLGHHSDMFAETAFIKLAWLLSNYSSEETKRLFGENLRGELGSRIEYKEEFIWI